MGSSLGDFTEKASGSANFQTYSLEPGAQFPWRQNGFIMSNGNGVRDEYGVYERLATLETQMAEIMKPKAPEKSALGVSEKLIIWLLIVAAATGNLPEVVAAMGKVITK
jgi:hypothetical protein